MESDEDEDMRLPAKERVHRFKKLAEQLAEVDFDVFKATEDVADAPRHGAKSFTQEAVQHWREVCVAADWNDFCVEANDFLHSLELVVLHCDTIVDLVLSRCVSAARLSLAPLLATLVALARDLQADFVPRLPRIFESLGALASEASGDPEVLQHVFLNVANTLKYQQKQLAGRVSWVLRHSRGLRHSVYRHVRCFAAQAFSFLLRKVPMPSLRAAVASAVQEAVAQRSERRTHATGLLLAEAILGPSNGLHSRAAVVLEHLLSPTLLVRAREGRGSDAGMRTQQSEASDAAATPQGLARIAAVSITTVDRLLDHLRRGKGQILWDVAFAALRSALDDAETTEAENPSKRAAKRESRQVNGTVSHTCAAVDPALAALRLAHVVALLAHMTEFFRGSRVEDFRPVFDAVASVLAAETTWPSAPGDVDHSAVAGAKRHALFVSEVDVTPDPEDFVDLTVSSQALRWLLAVVRAHGKAVGASAGMGAVAKIERKHAWDAAFLRAPQPELLALVQGLMNHPTSPAALEIFRVRVLGGLGFHVIAAGTDWAALDAPLAVLARAVSALSSPNTSASTNTLPLLFCAQPAGPMVVGHVHKIATAALQAIAESSETPEGTNAEVVKRTRAGGPADQQASGASRGAVAAAVAALRCLPAACKTADAVINTAQTALDVCVPRLAKAAARSDHSRTSGTAGALHACASADDYAALFAEAAGLLSQALIDAGRYEQFLQLVGHISDLLPDFCSSQIFMAAAADAFKRTRAIADGGTHSGACPADIRAAAWDVLSLRNLTGVLAAVEMNLEAPKQDLRAATLALLTAFQQPEEGAQDASSGAMEEDSQAANGCSRPTRRSQILAQLLRIETTPLTLETGRSFAVALGNVGNLLEYKRISALLLRPVVRALLGALHIKFRELWEPTAQALAAAMKHELDVTWPVVFSALQRTQTTFLASGKCNASARKLAARRRRSAANDVTTTPSNAPHLSAAGVSDTATSDIENAGPGLLSLMHDAAHGPQGGGGSDEGAALIRAGCTDDGTRVGLILRALTLTPPNTVERVNRDWMPLAIAYLASKQSSDAPAHEAPGGPSATASAEANGSGANGAVVKKGSAGSGSEFPFGSVEDGSHDAEDAKVSPSGCGGKDWRARLKDWLTLLSKLKAARNLYRGQELQALVAAQLLDVDPSIQALTLQCLLTFKVKALEPYMTHLSGYCDNKALKATLARFPLHSDAEDGIAPADRPTVVPVIIRLLFPRMRKRSGRLEGKGAPGSARAAILNKLAALQSHELQPLLELFLTSLAECFVLPADASEARVDDVGVTLAWWAPELGARDGAWWLETVDAAALAATPLRLRVGALNAIGDLLAHIGFRLAPFLSPLAAVTLAVLESAISEFSSAESVAAAHPARALRSHALRTFASMLTRFPGETDWRPFWQRLLAAVMPLAERLPMEAASADSVPALLQLIDALASSAHLLPVLGDRPSIGAVPAGLIELDENGDPVVIDTEADTADGAEPPTPAEVLQNIPEGTERWATGGHGSALLGAAIAALGRASGSIPSRDTALGILEKTIAMGPAAVDLVLARHIDALLRALYASVTASAAEARTGGRRPRGLAREIALLQHVAPLATDLENITTLADSLVAAVAGKHLGDTLATQALVTLAVLWRRSASYAHATATARREEGSESLRAAAMRLTPLLGRWSARHPRAALVDALDALSLLLPDLAPAVPHIKGATAMSASNLDEADYDRRLETYAALTAETWAALPQLSAPAVMHVCMSDARCPDDLALRSAAAASLVRLVDAAAAVEASKESAGALASTGSANSLPELITGALYREIVRHLATPQLPVRQEMLALLQRCAVRLPARFPALEQLTHTDVEADFFFNIAHVQLHRRSRALHKLTKFLGTVDTSSSLSLGTIQAVIIPLLHSLIVEGAGGGASAGGHGQKRGASDRALGVVDTALSTLQAVALRLPWPVYLDLLNRFLKVCKSKRHAKSGDGVGQTTFRNALRGACAVIDGFHFTEASKPRLAAPPLVQPAADAIAAARLRSFAAPAAATATSATTASTAANEKPARNHLDLLDTSAAEGERAGRGTDDIPTAEGRQTSDPGASDAADGADEDEEPAEDIMDEGSPGPAEAQVGSDERIQRALVTRILPSVLGLLHKDRTTVRAPVALAAVKLMRILPEATEHWQLPKVLQSVANLLSDRLQSVRDEARAVLVKVIVELGPPYVPFLCDVLTFALPSRGFTAHVLGYTLHACVHGLVESGCPPGALDESLENMLPLLEADLFSDIITDARDESTFATKHKEAKQQKSYDTYLLLARLVTFETHLDVLLLPVRDRLAFASAPRMRNKLKQLLQYAARGVQGNGSATHERMLSFVYGQLKAWLETDARVRAEVAAQSDLATGRARGEERDDANTVEDRKAALHESLVTEFALTLLLQRLRGKGAMPLAGNAALMSRLDPLVAPLVEALASRDTACVSLALKCLAALVQWPLPSLPTSALAASKRVALLLKPTPKSTHPIAQDSFKLLAALLRECPDFRPPTPQLRFLLTWAFTDFDDAGTRQTLFSLLKAILDRRATKVLEVYDVMARVQEMLVQSASAPLRAMCASTLLQFLLDWPLEERRLRQHLDFIVRNLAYEVEEGRLQVLEFLQNIFAKFPVAVLETRFTFFLMPIVARLVSDPSPACRRAVAAALKALLQRVGGSCRESAAETCGNWLASSDARLKRTAVQLLAILADVEGKAFARRVPVLSPAVLSILDAQGTMTSLVPVSTAAANAASAPNWQLAYHTLLLVEKLATAVPESLAWQGPPAESKAESDRAVLLKVWLTVVELLEHRHLWVQKAASRAIGVALASPALHDALLSQPSMPGRLAFSFFVQYEVPAADEAMLTQATKCLVSVCKALYAGETAANGGELAQLGLFARRPALNGQGVSERGARRARTANGVNDDNNDDSDDDGTNDESEGDDGAASESDDESDDEQSGGGINGDRARVLTVRGLFKRMARIASDRRAATLVHRLNSLRWSAVVSSHLGALVMLKHNGVLLQLVMKPVYRIQNNPELDSDEVKECADEVVSVLRDLVGADALAAAYSTARDAVAHKKAQRQRSKALLATNDPEAAAQVKLRRNEKRRGERKRKLTEVRQLREAGVRVKGKGAKRRRGALDEV